MELVGQAGSWTKPGSSCLNDSAAFIAPSVAVMGRDVVVLIPAVEALWLTNIESQSLDILRRVGILRDSGAGDAIVNGMVDSVRFFWY